MTATTTLYLLNGMNEYAVSSSVNPYLTDQILPVADKESPVFFVNGDGRLLEESDKSGANPLGNARSSVQMDFDGDGDLDMVVTNFNMPAIVYRNNAPRENHWTRCVLSAIRQKG